MFTTDLVFVLSGLTCGFFAGLVPGVGVLTSLILAYPFLHGAEIHQLILFYVALAATVQYTGTIPSVFVGMPGETNSVPAVIEGAKFTKHNAGHLAVGVCAIGSMFGSFIAVLIFLITSEFILQSFSLVVGNTFKTFLYLFVLISFLLFYNNKKIYINFFLLCAGMFFGMIGESPLSNNFRFTGGLEDLKMGIAISPFVCGILVIPSLISKKENYKKIQNIPNMSFLKPMVLFARNFTSMVRGSIIGFFAGMIPGLSTVMSTTISHNIESKIHANKPCRKILSAESANNSGQFASLLPLLIFGIPITGSEMFLYYLLIDSGWNPNQFGNVETNIVSLVNNILPWFIFINIIGVLIAWPFAKQASCIFKLDYKFLLLAVLTIIILVNLFLGHNEGRIISYIVQLAVFSAIGLALRKFSVYPILASFLLSNELESVFYREFLFLTIN